MSLTEPSELLTVFHSAWLLCGLCVCVCLCLLMWGPHPALQSVVLGQVAGNPPTLLQRAEGTWTLPRETFTVAAACSQRHSDTASIMAAVSFTESDMDRKGDWHVWALSQISFWVFFLAVMMISPRCCFALLSWSALVSRKQEGFWSATDQKYFTSLQSNSS